MKVAGLLPVLIRQDEGVAGQLVLVELPAVVDAVGGAGVVLLFIAAQIGLLGGENSGDLTEMETINTPNSLSLIS